MNVRYISIVLTSSLFKLDTKIVFIIHILIFIANIMRGLMFYNSYAP